MFFLRSTEVAKPRYPVTQSYDTLKSGAGMRGSFRPVMIGEATVLALPMMCRSTPFGRSNADMSSSELRRWGESTAQAPEALALTGLPSKSYIMGMLDNVPTIPSRPFSSTHPNGVSANSSRKGWDSHDCRQSSISKLGMP